MGEVTRHREKYKKGWGGGTQRETDGQTDWRGGGGEGGRGNETHIEI